MNSETNVCKCWVCEIKSALEYAAEAKMRDNKTETIAALKKVMLLGKRAVETKEMPPDDKNRMKEDLSWITKAYWEEVMVSIPKENIAFIEGLTIDLIELKIQLPPKEVAEMFETAKQRLGGEKEMLRNLYCNEQTPTFLRKYIELFLDGILDKEATEEIFDSCSACLRKWLPILFPM